MPALRPRFALLGRTTRTDALDRQALDLSVRRVDGAGEELTLTPLLQKCSEHLVQSIVRKRNQQALELAVGTFYFEPAGKKVAREKPRIGNAREGLIALLRQRLVTENPMARCQLSGPALHCSDAPPWRLLGK